MDVKKKEAAGEVPIDSEDPIEQLTAFTANRLNIVPQQADKRTCRKCHNQFFPLENSDKACPYHPESFAGETAQRWLPPGVTEGGAVVHYFYTCCGERNVNSPGCCYGK